jgi:uncharacterized protein (DUF1684 family)
MLAWILAWTLAAAPSDAVARHRAAMAKELLDKDGPLSIVGRLEIPRGHATVGRAAGSTLLLATPAAPARLGTVDWDGRRARLQFEAAASVNGKPVKETTIETVAGKDVRLSVRSGTVTLGFVWSHLNEAFYVRVFDDDAPKRARPVARAWYDENARYRIVAIWTPAAPGTKMVIHRADGITSELVVPGVARFTLDGKTYELTAVGVEEGKLFFPFRDLTAPHETYGRGGFCMPTCRRTGV